ncbi:hypothetical protein F511_18119 [Dorcoceras hygrometricum]|uniref:Uncharacterized protein n=1 Tax=Dorcoceras hygrometricum TaxID=472368 RepID=A0A2Z7BAB3_9LAMI|nr:hypothetical protein F511_44813 [Dorcoceras hygrometricum]KZV22068.1 hypothetical protein F511_35360 [Dorcoceras hygrometricum]KZV31015.1 hypothetical protein F511_18119 [Dorcoceras hygrometricum]
MYVSVCLCVCVLPESMPESQKDSRIRKKTAARRIEDMGLTLLLEYLEDTKIRRAKAICEFVKGRQRESGDWVND